MQQITLKKKHFNGHQVYLMPNWISNGHWAIRKELVRNAAVFASKATVQGYLGEKQGVNEWDSNDFVEKILAKFSDSTQEFSKTNWVYENTRSAKDSSDVIVFRNCSSNVRPDVRF